VRPPLLALRTGDVAGTLALAETLAGALRPGDVVALTGELGAGKTRFVEGACRALGVRGRVRSPSYTLLNVYRGRLPVYHLDLYRWDPGPHAAEIEEWEELMDGEGVAFIEWAERFGAALPPRAWRVAIAFAGENGRRFEIVVPEERRADLETRLAPWVDP
jgi:tRNA threonylcarbamoyladenosine biosynthesis protein TsaE